MSGRPACINFSQHAWKKDLCANCQKLRSDHADVPKPAKRVSKGLVSSKDTQPPVKEASDKKEPTPKENSSGGDQQKGKGTEGSTENGGHYYHKYDITQKGGSSGKPEKPDKLAIAKKIKEKESAKTAAFVHTFIPVEDFTLGREQKYKESVEESRKKLLQHQRVVAVAAAEQHVALPYTIVDVSTIPHDVDPERLESKPQTPNNPPVHPATVPRRSKPKSPQTGHGTAPAPAKRQDGSATTPMPRILHNDEQHNKDKVLSPNSQRKVAILIPSAPIPVTHVYEDIDNDDGKMREKSPKPDDEGKRSTVDSSKFDANRQAIGKNLDLQKENKATVDSASNEVESASSKQIDQETQDRSRKTSTTSSSSGKGFLSRFFSKGSKSDEGQTSESRSDGKPVGKQIAAVSKEGGYLRSKSVDSESTNQDSEGAKETNSPTNRVRKSVVRSESTKEQTALQSELKNILVKATPKETKDNKKDSTSYENAAVIAVMNSKGSNSPVNSKIEASTAKNITAFTGKKPEAVAKPDKCKKPEIARKPETPPLSENKRISIAIDKRSSLERPQISPPKPIERPHVPPPMAPVSPVKSTVTRRSNSSVEERPVDPTNRLSCDTSLKSDSLPDSPVSPGKLEISMPKLEQSTVNVEMITSIYDSTSPQPRSPRETDSPRSPSANSDKVSTSEVVSRDKTAATYGVKTRPKSDYIKARAVKRMSAAPPPPPPDGAPASPPVTGRGALDTSLVPDDLMTKSFDRSFTHSTLPTRFKTKPKMPNALPPEKAARNRRQAKAETAAPGRSRTLTEGIDVQPSTDLSLNDNDKSADGDDSNGKFVGRALPSPPSHRRPHRDNVYEAIDDDVYYDDIVELSKSLSFDSNPTDTLDDPEDEVPGTVVGDLLTDVLSVTGNVMTTSAEYLEPISRSDSGSDGVLSVNTTTTLNKEKLPTPAASPNNAINGDRAATPPSASTSVSYTNYIDALRCDPHGARPPADNFATAFLEMDAIHTRTLAALVADVCCEPQVIHDSRGPGGGRLKMTDFKMEEKKPVLSHSSCMFYKVSTNKLEEMHNCILMISQKKSPAVLSGCNNMNILKPVAVFSENTPVENSDVASKAATTSNYSTATLGVFNFANISSLHDYLSRKFRSSQPSVPHVKQNTILYLLIQVLNGLTWMAEHALTPRSLTPTDVLVVTSTKTSDQRLLLNPFRTKEPAADKKLSLREAAQRFYGDFVKLALSVINIEMTDRVDLARGLRSAGYADHSVALSYALCLPEEGEDALVAAKQILEVSLWGPSGDQRRTMLDGTDPLMACHVWLALQRCTILSSHAVQGCSAAASWENTAYLNFLSNCTPEILLRIVRKISI